MQHSAARAMAQARAAAVRLASAAAARCAELLRGADLQDEDGRQREGAVLLALLTDKELLQAVDAAAGQLPLALMVCQHLARELLQHVGSSASHVRSQSRCFSCTLARCHSVCWSFPVPLVSAWFTLTA